MVKAWYFDNNYNYDQREPHYDILNGIPRMISIDSLSSIGVIHQVVLTNEPKWRETLAEISSKTGYNHSDELVISKDKLENYEMKLKMFFEEHIHEDDEVRFVVEGSGYFDVKDRDDKWIRILVEKNDLIVLPAGIYHRFTLDESNYIQVIRLFKDNPKWIAINRPEAEDYPARADYLSKFSIKLENVANLL